MTQLFIGDKLHLLHRLRQALARPLRQVRRCRSTEQSGDTVSNLPASVHTIHLVDAEGRSWGSMSRQEYEDWIERQTLRDAIVAEISAAYDKHLSAGQETP